MYSKVLYFPYINIPQSDWTKKVLLYWDSVGIIVPDEYRRNPNRYEINTRELLTSGLITQIIPQEHTNNQLALFNSFNTFISSPDFEIEKKRKSFQNYNIPKPQIHVEKFDNGLMNNLVDLGIATRIDWRWYQVEKETAIYLMSYLAAVLGEITKMTPITDSIKQYFVNPVQKETRNEILRSRILNSLLPLPLEYSIEELVHFKEKYSNQLKRFRNRIERLIIELNSSESSDDLLNNYIEEFQMDKEEISRRMSESFFSEELSLAQYVD